jgi:hypothetical protein
MTKVHWRLTGRTRTGEHAHRTPAYTRRVVGGLSGLAAFGKG